MIRQPKIILLRDLTKNVDVERFIGLAIFFGTFQPS